MAAGRVRLTDRGRLVATVLGTLAGGWLFACLEWLALPGVPR